MSKIVQKLMVVAEGVGGVEVFLKGANGNVIIEPDLHQATKEGTRGYISKFWEDENSPEKDIPKKINRMPERW